MQPSDRELSIGVFARKSRLSMRALRLYEQISVLKPVRVDPCTGYRLYAESQLAVARLIGMLRALDMPLAQVAEVTSELGAKHRRGDARPATLRIIRGRVQARIAGPQPSGGAF